MERIVRLKEVSKDYFQGDLIVNALRGINLSIQAGDFTSVAGPSGSGKTTLLNIIGGLDRPRAGVVEVEGHSLSELSAKELSKLRRDRIGFIFQNLNLIPVFTVLENAEYVLMIQRVKQSHRREKVMELLKEIGLEGMESRFPRELSGGQQQRVAIARAIAAEPALVLADEPTANVDFKTAHGIIDLMRRLNEEKGITFLFSTHDQKVMKRAKNYLWLEDGRISTTLNYS